MKSIKSNSLNRRELLKLIGSLPATLPISQLTQMVVGGIMQRAWAQASGVSGNRYVFFFQGGAPARWMFDQFCTPYNTSAFTPNPGLATTFTDSGGIYTGLAYQTIQRKGLNVPPLWGASVPSPTGALRPLDTLLDNMLSIRGINTGASGHPLARVLSFQPIGAQYTLTGLAAESGKGFPIKAINGSCQNYSLLSPSPMSVTSIPVNGQRTGLSLLSPFNSQPKNLVFKTTQNQIKAELSAAASALDAYAQSQHPGAALVKSAQGDADQIMSGAITALLSKWDALYSKYAALVKSTLSNSVVLPGINEKPVGAPVRPTTTQAKAPYQLVQGIYCDTPIDMREMINSNTTISGVPEAFALAELCLTENICNSIALNTGCMMNFTANGAFRSQPPDEHYTGSFVSLFINSKTWAAYGACLLELVTVLKSAGIFDSTVIHVGGEFNRNPEKLMWGSDHGFQGASAMLLSGKVQGPLVVGNILKTPPIEKPGTWGWGAPTVNNRVLDNADLANAIAQMLQVPDVVRRPESDRIIGLLNGKVVSKVGPASQI